MNCSIILPNQLFYNNLLCLLSDVIYLIEDNTFFIKYPFHKQKLILHRASMKSYYDYLISLNKKVYYIDSNNTNNIYDEIFKSYKVIYIFDPEDNYLLKKFNNLNKQYSNLLEIHPNSLFIETKKELDEYYKSLKSHVNFIHDSGFYKWQRKRLNILMQNKKPLYNKLSFDHDNRNKFDQNYKKYYIPKNNTSYYIDEAKKYVLKYWNNNFGSIDQFIYPINHKQAKELFNHFLKYKISSFGKYQDATSINIQFGSHSLLSSSLNIGLISPIYILNKIIKAFDKLNLDSKKKAIPNVEGYIRQLIGWRSYVRFIYIYHGNNMLKENKLEHYNKLPDTWYNGTTGIYPIDFLIKKVEKYAYTHHIERLMYLGNFALLCRIKPKDIYKWFMICFIDSYEWVMVANVFGMSQYSTNSIKMMTRPYFSSSNYIKNMSDFKLNSYNKINDYYWNEIWDALYYNFINNNYNILKNIYATARNVSHWDKKTKLEQNKLLKIAKDFLK
jgi:deoxyribodipyrimidine photolyase-related protein